jgi:hypothetical protein
VKASVAGMIGQPEGFRDARNEPPISNRTVGTGISSHARSKLLCSYSSMVRQTYEYSHNTVLVPNTTTTPPLRLPERYSSTVPSAVCQSKPYLHPSRQ